MPRRSVRYHEEKPSQLSKYLLYAMASEGKTRDYEDMDPEEVDRILPEGSTQRAIPEDVMPRELELRHVIEKINRKEISEMYQQVKNWVLEANKFMHRADIPKRQHMSVENMGGFYTALAALWEQGDSLGAGTLWGRKEIFTLKLLDNLMTVARGDTIFSTRSAEGLLTGTKWGTVYGDAVRYARKLDPGNRTPENIEKSLRYSDIYKKVIKAYTESCTHTVIATSFRVYAPYKKVSTETDPHWMVINDDWPGWLVNGRDTTVPTHEGVAMFVEDTIKIMRYFGYSFFPTHQDIWPAISELFIRMLWCMTATGHEKVADPLEKAEETEVEEEEEMFETKPRGRSYTKRGKRLKREKGDISLANMGMKFMMREHSLMSLQQLTTRPTELDTSLASAERLVSKWRFWIRLSYRDVVHTENVLDMERDVAMFGKEGAQQLFTPAEEEMFGEGFFDTAYQKIANAYRSRYCPGARMLEKGEFHPLCANWMGPGTVIEKALKYPAANAADQCARIHDLEYKVASEQKDENLRRKLIRIADEKIMKCLDNTHDYPYTDWGKAGINLKMRGEDLAPGLLHMLMGETGKKYLGKGMTGGCGSGKMCCVKCTSQLPMVRSPFYSGPMAVHN